MEMLSVLIWPVFMMILAVMAVESLIMAKIDLKNRYVKIILAAIVLLTLFKIRPVSIGGVNLPEIYMGNHLLWFFSLAVPYFGFRLVMAGDEIPKGSWVFLLFINLAWIIGAVFLHNLKENREIASGFFAGFQQFSYSLFFALFGIIMSKMKKPPQPGQEKKMLHYLRVMLLPFTVFAITIILLLFFKIA